jgi:hypothetical protein
MIPPKSEHRRPVWIATLAIASGLFASAAAQERATEVALPDIARQIAKARQAAEADGASLEDRIRFATWALMVAEIAIEPHGLISTASDLFDDGQAALDELREELAGDPEAQKALVIRAPLLAARLDTASVRQERITARRELARAEERKRLNDLRSIAKAFRSGLAAQSEAQAWAAIGDAAKAEATLADAWRALDDIDRTVASRRDFFLMEDEPDIEGNPDATLITEAPTAFRSAAVVANAKALAALRLLSSLDQNGDGLFANAEAAAILEKAITWANAALAENADPPDAPKGSSPDNVFALYARGRATALAAVLRAWGAPFDKAVGKEVATSLKQAADDCTLALEKLKGHEDSSIYLKLSEFLKELESPKHVQAKITRLIDAGLMDRAVTESRSLAMRQPEPDFVAFYLDTARRAGLPLRDLQNWCRRFVAGGAGLDPRASPALSVAVARLAVDAAASRMTSAEWSQAAAQERQTTARDALAAREIVATPVGVPESDAATLAATRALLAAYAWLASPDVPGGKALLASAVEDARNAELFLSQVIAKAVTRDRPADVLDARESLMHCRLARGFLAIALLPEYRDEARLAFAAALDEAGRLPAGGSEHGMLGSPLLTSLLRGNGAGQAAKLVAEERATRQAMTRFVEACFTMEFGSPTQATEQFRIAHDMAQRGSDAATAADAAELMRVADGFDVAITLPESMGAFETLGFVAAGKHDEALRRAVLLSKQQGGSSDLAPAAGKPIDFDAFASEAASFHSPLVAYAVLRALDARLDAVPLGQDPARSGVLRALRACHARCSQLLDTARQRDRYPHIVELVTEVGRELDNPATFASAEDVPTVERALRRHPAATSLWNRYFDLIDQAAPTGAEGRVAAERALAVLESLATDPLVPAAALTLTRATLLERLSRYPLAQQAYAQARESGMSAEDRVVAASREAVLMVRNAFPMNAGSADPRAR